jgi:uncharacterized protein (TIGR00369 family)
MPFPEHEDLSFPDSTCFGCSTSHPTGLRLRFRRDGDVVSARYTVADRFHGAPGIVHGGIVATLLDEVSCAAIFFVREQMVVTGELTVRYARPCPVDVPLDLTARVIDETSRYLVVEGTIRRDGVELARSTGKFFPQKRAESAP